MSPAFQPHPETITLEQYEALPENRRTEVFENIAFDMASPSQEHQIISMELSTILNTYLKSKNGPCRVFHAPFDVKLNDAPLTIVQPDLMIVCDKNKLDGKRCNALLTSSLKLFPPATRQTIISANCTITKMPESVNIGLQIRAAKL